MECPGACMIAPDEATSAAGALLLVDTLVRSDWEKYRHISGIYSCWGPLY